MEKSEILDELNAIFRKVFNNPSIVVSEKMVAADLEDWDSLNHAQMISAVEKHFNIKFKLSEMLSFKNVGNLIDTIEKKLNQ